MSFIPESHLDLFDLPAVWHVATIGPNGEPHVSPVWADFDGTYIRFPHKLGRQKWHSIFSIKWQKSTETRNNSPVSMQLP